MKRVLWMIAVISFINFGAEAQQEQTKRKPITPEKIAERMTERMAKELDLSDEQRREVYALHLENARKRADEMKAQREKIKAEQKAQQEKLEAILSPEQKAQWEAKKFEAREKRSLWQEKKRQDGNRGERPTRNRHRG
jgi:protein CpxP